MPTIVPTLLARLLLHPARQLGADAATSVIGVDGGVAAVVAGVLGVGDEAVALEDADGVLGTSYAGPLPVADDVGLLDHDLADVVELLGGHHLGDGGGVGRGQRAFGEPSGRSSCAGMPNMDTRRGPRHAICQ